MTINRIDEPVLLPRIESAILSDDPQAFNDAFREFTNRLEEILRLLIDQVNTFADTDDDGVKYSQGKETDGQYPLGTWRHRQSGDNFIREVLKDRANDTWTEAGAEEPAI